MARSKVFQAKACDYVEFSCKAFGIETAAELGRLFSRNINV